MKFLYIIVLLVCNTVYAEIQDPCLAERNERYLCKQERKQHREANDNSVSGQDSREVVGQQRRAAKQYRERKPAHKKVNSYPAYYYKQLGLKPNQIKFSDLDREARYRIKKMPFGKEAMEAGRFSPLRFMIPEIDNPVENFIIIEYKLNKLSKLKINKIRKK